METVSLNVIKQSPWKADSRSDKQQTPRLLWNPNIHHRDHTPGDFGPHALISFSKMHYNIILPPTPMSSKWPLTFRFSYKNL